MSWSQELIDETKEILLETPSHSFQGLDGCALKNLDGRKGAIRFDDAMSKKYRVYVKAQKNRVEYSTLQALLDDGWVVD